MQHLSLGGVAFVLVRRLLSSCGVQVFSSLVAVHRFQGAQALSLWHAGSRTGGDPGVAPGNTSGSLLYGQESALPPTAPFNLVDINNVSPSGGFVT
ncbi:hypothetical protein J1605_004017 [Eschrichtius robustus]|uniref:Secreted protein n=1 Tax=Eschrichtius robustus TaxID=9764 RepID=A0AB34HP14_ESCRO|nr:hypothetical protein J1605_004017 [Eschrichtius robustus]